MRMAGERVPEPLAGLHGLAHRNSALACPGASQASSPCAATDSVLVRTRLPERGLLRYRGATILTVAASHHDSADSLKRGGHHSRHLVNAARQLRDLPAHCGEGHAELSLLPLEGSDSLVDIVEALVKMPVRVVDSLVDVVKAPVYQLHIRPSLRSQTNGSRNDCEREAERFHIR